MSETLKLIKSWGIEWTLIERRSIKGCSTLWTTNKGKALHHNDDQWRHLILKNDQSVNDVWNSINGVCGRYIAYYQRPGQFPLSPTLVTALADMKDCGSKNLRKASFLDKNYFVLCAIQRWDFSFKYRRIWVTNWSAYCFSLFLRTKLFWSDLK